MAVLPPSPQLEILIKKESNEDDNSKNQCLEIIKEWLLQQPHLPNAWDDVLIINFLRGCKFSLEKCKQKLDKHFTVKSTTPEFFSNRTFKREELLKESTLLDCVPLPKLTDKGHSVTVYRLSSKTVGYFPEAIKLCFMILDMRIREEKFGNSGHVAVVDVENLTASHLTAVTPTLLKKVAVTLFEAYPIRIKGIHVINIHPLVNIIFSWIKPLIKQKIIDRFHFHNSEKSSKCNYESLYNFIPKDVLPEEYGGDSGCLRDLSDLWIQKLKDNEAFFAELDSYKVDETKRVGKLVSHEVLFGVEGSFKKLSID